MTSAPPGTAKFSWAPLVPELLVSDIKQSLWFWFDLCGFPVSFDRLHEGFASWYRGGAQVMLEERGRNLNWVTGPLELPLGRGVNFEIVVPTLDPEEIAAAVETLQAVLVPGGILRLSWRVTEGSDGGDEHGRLYSAFEPARVLHALTATLLMDEQSGR